MITGAAGGIGRAIAISIAAAGANVALGTHRRAGTPCQLEVEACGATSIISYIDVSKTHLVERFYSRTIKELGPVDILVNCAGICLSQRLCGHSEEDWLDTIDINLNGVFRTTRLCLPGMIARRWGRIINITSDIAAVGVPEYAAYCTSKAAVVGLTKCAGREGAPHGVTCNAISPGWVDTEMTERTIRAAAAAEGADVAAYLEKVRRQNPQNRLISPAEIAELAVFLCREEARAITMQDVLISGGTSW